MTMQLSVSPLDDAADIDGARNATELLVDANRATPSGRLLGSITIPRTDFALDQYADVIVLARRSGRVDLARDASRIVGVACWIEHPAGRRATTPARPAAPSGMTRRPAALRGRDAHERLGRLDVLDLALGVPDDTTHLHLACLGTATGHQSRMVTDMLLHHQSLLADREQHTLYTEAHSDKDRDWLHRHGYNGCGPSLGYLPDPQSYVLARTAQRPSRPDQGTPAARGDGAL